MTAEWFLAADLTVQFKCEGSTDFQVTTLRTQTLWKNTA